MRKLIATYLIGQSTWTVLFAVLACFVTGAVLKAISPDSTAAAVLGGLSAGIIAGVLVWRIESRGQANVEGAWRLLN